MQLVAALYGCEDSTVSAIIHAMLPYFVEYFTSYITHENTSESHSVLSTLIRYILDGTIHPRRKARYLQHLWYNGHYEMHGMMTQLLVNFDGFIMAVVTNIAGHNHDAGARYCDLIEHVVGDDYAIADTAYSGIDYCVAGFKANQLTSEGRERFDTITRHEQVLVENVNSFFKKARSVAKETKFIHSTEMQTAAVLICCGLYNFRKLTGSYVEAGCS